MKKSAHRPPSVRALKVGEQMRHVLADIFQQQSLNDPLLEGVILSVSEVQVSSDLGHATAYIMPVGQSEERQQQILKALARHRRKLRQLLARRVNIKYAAELHFRIDQSFAEGAYIDALLRRPEVARDLEGRESIPSAEED